MREDAFEICVIKACIISVVLGVTAGFVAVVVKFILWLF